MHSESHTGIGVYIQIYPFTYLVILSWGRYFSGYSQVADTCPAAAVHYPWLHLPPLLTGRGSHPRIG